MGQCLTSALPKKKWILNGNKTESQLRGTYGKSSLLNPSTYKDDFNHFSPLKPVGMLPNTTDARVLPSQSYYKSTRSFRDVETEKPKLDDTFGELENELIERQDEAIVNPAAQFHLQTPPGVKLSEGSHRAHSKNVSFSSKSHGGNAQLSNTAAGRAMSGVGLGNPKSSILHNKTMDRSLPAYYKDEAYIPKIGMGYEEGRELYESLHARRSKGLPPVTKLAAEHFEVESSIFHRGNNDYGKFDSNQSMTNPHHHRIHNSRRSYNPLTNDILSYRTQE